MLKLISVTIGNYGDDSYRFELLAYDSEDSNVSAYLNDICETFLDNNDYNNEFIVSISEIKPKNISSEKALSDKIDKIFN